MKKIDTLLLTGSTGFVGQSFLNFLETIPRRHLPSKLILISRHNSIGRKYSFENEIEVLKIESDLRKPWGFEYKVSHILNLAADGSSNSYTNEAGMDFVKIGRNLSCWIKSWKPKVVVHASSGACFGIKAIGETKNILTQDKSVFIKSRLESEECISISCKESEIRNVIARLFTFIGPELLNKKQYAVSSFINDAVLKNSINITGNKNTVRSYMNESTMSMWLYNCLVNSQVKNMISIGSSIPVTIESLAKFISKETGASINYVNSDAPGDYYVANNTTEKQILKVTEGVDWQQSVRQCIELLESRKSD